MPALDKTHLHSFLSVFKNFNNYAHIVDWKLIPLSLMFLLKILIAPTVCNTSPEMLKKWQFVLLHYCPQELRVLISSIFKYSSF